MISASIPYDFVRERVRPSWTDALYALEHQLVKPEFAIALASDQLNQDGRPDAEILAIASSGRDEPILGLVTKLAGREKADVAVRERWLYLVLDWIFEHRYNIDDPLAEVETVYADFGYPAEISTFVRYMPMTGPDLGSVEQNETRLYERWKDYLDSMARRFSPS